MDSNRPRQPQGILLVTANLFLFYLFLHLVEVISHVAPCGRLHHDILSIFCSHVYLGIIVLVETDDGSQGSVDPLVLYIVFDKDDLCARLQI